jgi:hypothetical protein
MPDGGDPDRGRCDIEQGQIKMARRSSNSYDYALSRREVETAKADTFEAEFPVITG